jgi:hypothetical protein
MEKTNSPIKGRVIIRKSDGTIILDKDNMVVEVGRRFLKELFINSLVKKESTVYSNEGIIEPSTDGSTSLLGGGNSTYTREFDGYFLNYVGFGDSGTATEFNATDLYGVNKVYFSLKITDTPKIIFPLDSTNLSVSFKAEIDNTRSLTGFLAEELGLFISKKTLPGLVETKKLFSRIAFDPIPVSSGDRYEIEYFLYF